MNRILYILTIFFGLFFLLPQANATHLVGGEITYECLGDNMYRITMKIYRNCNSASQGAFPDPAPMTIYSGSGNTYTQVRNRDIFLVEDFPPEIDPPNTPCLTIPPDVCVEAGTYVWEVELPTINDTYTIVHQRCCRNGSITNIFTPGDVGITYSVEITPTAQASCNNSPVFNDFPPTVICANQPLVFDHSATDQEGDQLVYEFCSPLQGGGLAGTNGNPGSSTGCDGWRPNPACPPPFDEVNFVLPTYSPLAPMQGDPVVTIDPLTGVITGTPNIIGQFVVGVCVSEYRNGVLLSTLRRDFQFNVSDCVADVVAQVESAEIEDGVFIINSCGDSIVDVFNTSLQQQNIDEIEWGFDILGDSIFSDSWSIELALPDTGVYNGYLYLNEDECGDTAFVRVNLYPPVNADFTFDYDTCDVSEVVFNDESFTASENIKNWIWNLGDGTTSTEKDPTILYVDPSSYPVSLSVETETGCLDTMVQFVNWFPVPPLIIIEPSSFVGCPPANIFFNNLTSPIDNNYELNWEFGDGETSTEISPTHDYAETGSYSIDVEVISPFGCVTQRTFQNWINITPTPIANFNYEPNEISIFDPTVNFIDSSEFANSWFWDFNDESIAFSQNPSYTFRDTGLQEITLLVTHPNGCADTIIRQLDIIPEVTFYMPNAFTPNGDGENDLFLGNGYTRGLRAFSLEIWNRWGELIFKTDDPLEGWNGTKNNVGNYSPEGVYIYKLFYTAPRGENYEQEGFVTLIR